VPENLTEFEHDVLSSAYARWVWRRPGERENAVLLPWLAHYMGLPGKHREVSKALDRLRELGLNPRRAPGAEAGSGGCSRSTPSRTAARDPPPPPSP
jgi:hypothetical protein